MVGAATETNCHGNTESSFCQMWPVAMDGIRGSHSAFVIEAQNFFIATS